MDTIMPVDERYAELARSLQDRGVEYVFASFVDVTGRTKSKCVPVEHLPELIAGHERYTPRGLGNLGQMTPDEDECVTVPDPETLCILPWDTRFAHMVADLYYGGREPFAALHPLGAQAAGRARPRPRDCGCCSAWRPSCTWSDPLIRRTAARPRGGRVPRADPAVRAYPSDRRLRRRVDARRHGLSRSDGQGHAAVRLRGLQLRPRGWGRPGGVRLRPRPGPATWRTGSPSSGSWPSRSPRRRASSATFMPKPYTDAWGSGAHFNMSLVDARTARTSSGMRTTGGDGDGARSRTASSPGSSGTPRVGRDLHAHGQLVQTAPATPERRHRCRGLRPGRRTATTTGRACSASPATGPAWRTGASTPPPTPTWPRRFCWRPGWKA